MCLPNAGASAAKITDSARVAPRHRLLLLPLVLRNFLEYRSTVHGFYKNILNIGSPYMGFKDVRVLLAHPCMGFKGIS